MGGRHPRGPRKNLLSGEDSRLSLLPRVKLTTLTKSWSQGSARQRSLEPTAKEALLKQFPKNMNANPDGQSRDRHWRRTGARSRNFPTLARRKGALCWLPDVNEKGSRRRPRPSAKESRPPRRRRKSGCDAGSRGNGAVRPARAGFGRVDVGRANAAILIAEPIVDAMRELAARHERSICLAISW